MEHLADGILRGYLLAAVRADDRATLDEIAKASRFWGHSREELLQENPYELRRQGKLLRCFKAEQILHNGDESTHAIHNYALALHHAAGFLLATESESE